MKIANKKILILFLFFVILNIVAVSDAGANFWKMQQGLGDDFTSDSIAAAFGQNPGTEPTNLQVTIALLIKVFLGFLAIIFLVLMLIGGFKWMTSQGNETTITEAKSMLKAATIGMTIVLMSYAVTAFVARCFYDISSGGGSMLWMCQF